MSDSGALEVTNSVVERAAFEAEELVGVAQVELALDFIGVHGLFAEQAEDGE